MTAKIRRRKCWEEIPKSCHFEENELFDQRARKSESIYAKEFLTTNMVFKSVIKLCHLLMEISFISQSQGLNSW